MPSRDLAIIIVSYKSAELTVDCLRSVARERGDGALRIRCVVVDNASGDTPRVAAAIRDEGWSDWARVITAERNGGFAYGNNAGLAEILKTGEADYVHLLNPDTVLHPGALHRLVEFMEAHARVGIAGGVFENGDGSEWAIAFRFPSLASELEQGLQLGLASRVLSRWRVPMEMGREARPVDWVSGASMMIRRDVFRRIGGLDESFFLYFEETEFCHRAKAAGFEVWYVPDSRVTHIAGQSTKVTERNVGPRRLPGYWFDSRRRFFTLTHGPIYAALADATALVAGAVGSLKRAALGRSGAAIPSFLGDLFRHSALKPARGRPAPPPPSVPRFE